MLFCLYYFHCTFAIINEFLASNNYQLKKVTMKFTIFLSAVLFAAFPVYAQIQSGSIEIEKLKEASFEYKFSQSFDIEGSMYYEDEWQVGHTIFESGEVSDLYKLKYNIFNNNLLLQRNGIAYIIKPNSIKGFAFVEGGNRTLFRSGFTSNKYDIYSSTYLRMVYDGRVKLAVKYGIDKSEDLDVFTGERTIYLEREESYYLITADGVFHEVSLDKNDILEVLDNYQNKLRKFADRNDLSFEDEADLKKILAHYDALASADPRHH